MKIKTGQGNMTLQKLIAIYSISMVTSLPGLAISPILGKLESIFSSTSELQQAWSPIIFRVLTGQNNWAMCLRSLTSRWLSPLYWPVFWPVSAGIYPLSYIVSQVFPCFSHSIWTKNHLSIPPRPKRQLRFNSRRHIIIKNTTG